MDIENLKEQKVADDEFNQDSTMDWTDGLITYTDEVTTPSFTFRVFLLGKSLIDFRDVLVFFYRNHQHMFLFSDSSPFYTRVFGCAISISYGCFYGNSIARHDLQIEFHGPKIKLFIKSRKIFCQRTFAYLCYGSLLLCYTIWHL